jgi:hypothetical protein
MTDHKQAAEGILAGPARRFPEASDSLAEMSAAQVHATLHVATLLEELAPKMLGLMDPTPRPMSNVAAEIVAERDRQRRKGYDEAHDDEHGLQHIMAEVQTRVAGRLWSRVELVEAAAVLVAAIEWLDRNAEAE